MMDMRGWELVRVRRVLVDGPGDEREGGDEERMRSWRNELPGWVDGPASELNGSSVLDEDAAALRSLYDEQYPEERKREDKPLPLSFIKLD
jgi:hypothetical protein